MAKRYSVPESLKELVRNQSDLETAQVKEAKVLASTGGTFQGFRFPTGSENTFAFRPYSSQRSVQMARRGKRRGPNNTSGPGVDPTVALLIKDMASRGEKFTNRKAGAKTQTRSTGKRKKSVARLLAKGQVGQAGYAAITGDFGIQVGCSISEMLAGLATTAINVAVQSTETRADDKAFPWVMGGIANLARYGASKYVAKKHPGLAAVMSAGASASSGVVWSQKALEWGVKVADQVKSKSGT